MRRFVSALLYFGFLATGNCNTNAKAAEFQARVCYFGHEANGRQVERQHNWGRIYNCEFVSAQKSDSSAIAFECQGSDSAWKAASGRAESNGLADAQTARIPGTNSDNRIFKFQYELAPSAQPPQQSADVFLAQPNPSDQSLTAPPTSCRLLFNEHLNEYGYLAHYYQRIAPLVLGLAVPDLSDKRVNGKPAQPKSVSGL
jgi:hypothetical protein